MKFSTAPAVKSDKVLKLAKAGLMPALLTAIKNERKGIVRDSNGITVTRVGSYNKHK